MVEYSGKSPRFAAFAGRFLARTGARPGRDGQFSPLGQVAERRSVRSALQRGREDTGEVFHFKLVTETPSVVLNMRIVVLLLLSVQLSECTERKRTVFLSQLQNTDLQLTFQSSPQQPSPAEDARDYFYEENSPNRDRLRRYMRREDGDFLISYGDQDEMLVAADQDE